MVISNYIQGGEPIMRSYLFEYNDNVDDFGEISFCSSTLEEAFELFDDYCKEELNTSALSILTGIRRVYNSDDAEEYGENYE